jgi:hypothetical protein
MLEIYRVLKLGGILQLELPFFPGRMAVAAWDHVSFFSPDSFFLLLDPVKYQPKMQPHDLLCKFDLVGNIDIELGLRDRLSEDFNMGLGDITGKLWLKKIDPDWWRLRNAHKDLKTQVYGCFYCQTKLTKISEDTKKCPDCNEEYTWNLK